MSSFFKRYNLPLQLSTLLLSLIQLQPTVATTFSNIDTLGFSSGANGFRVNGGAINDNLGSAVSSAGDFNGDQRNDIVISAAGATVGTNKWQAGICYVIFGSIAATTSFSDFDVAAAAFTSGSTGFKILGAVSYDRLGISVSGAGDVNNDGFDDIILGAPAATPSSKAGAGIAYVIFGHEGPFPDIDLSTFVFGTDKGFKVSGALAGDAAGWSVSGAGDVNNDGYADVIVSAYKALHSGSAGAGRVFVLFGHSTSSSFPNVELSSMTTSATTGFRLNGFTSGGNLGYSVRGLGDVNGDDIDDFVVAAKGVSSGSGRTNGGIVYVVFGRTTTFTDIAVFSAFNTGIIGFKILGPVFNSAIGSSVSGAGDYNGDGINDIIIGAHMASYSGRTNCGLVFVVFGRKISPHTEIDLSIPSIEFQVIRGGTGDMVMGIAVAGIGDMNGDGFDDLVMGANQARPFDRFYAGEAFVIFGHTNTTSFPDIDEASPLGEAGFTMYGSDTSLAKFGSAVDRAGDFNGDGLDDFLVGAPGMTIGGLTNSGAVYLFFGRYPPPTPMPSAAPTGPTSQPSSTPTMQPSRQPTSRPSRQPSSQPSAGPSAQPSSLPSMQPSCQPSRSPSLQPTTRPTGPSSQPTEQPSSQPSQRPSAQPSGKPSTQPSELPSCQPSMQPSSQPSSQPSQHPTSQPSEQPSVQPTSAPSGQPTSVPSAQPTQAPSCQPTMQPSSQPSSQPSQHPTSQPSEQPSVQPTSAPSGQPSSVPSAQPTQAPSCQPSSEPSAQPSSQPSQHPTSQPSEQPSVQPTSAPSGHPSSVPSAQPTQAPSCQPSSEPSSQPSSQPSLHPTSQPSEQPSVQPTSTPSGQPSSVPSAKPSQIPSRQPSSEPSAQPSTQPSQHPTSQPSEQPSVQPTSAPSGQPSSVPSAQPTQAPSCQPTMQPISQPSSQPSQHPTSQPSEQPSLQRTSAPSGQPSSVPSAQPTQAPSCQPTMQPISQPSSQPSQHPTSQPSEQPSLQPTSAPSGQPSSVPSAQPTQAPSCQPTMQPSVQPSSQPSLCPTSQPSGQPSVQPTSVPSTQPTSSPSRQPSCQPSSQPTGAPSRQPLSAPSTTPTGNPTTQPVCNPTSRPSAHPSAEPSSDPSTQPSSVPTMQPFQRPSVVPSAAPSSAPSVQPSGQPTVEPSAQPSFQPSGAPSSAPSIQPSNQPSGQPTSSPSSVPSSQPSGRPSSQPSSPPSCQPSEQPTSQPVSLPSAQPSEAPTSQPSATPSAQPSSAPTVQPTGFPTSVPSTQPSAHPSKQPTSSPSAQPTELPSSQPTTLPSTQPSEQPSRQPNTSPSARPSATPTLVYNATTGAVAVPNVTIATVTELRTSVTLQIVVTGRVGVQVFCAAFPGDTYVLAATAAIRNQNYFVFGTPGVLELNVTNLLPVSTYSVFCTAMTADGSESSLEASRSTRVVLTTLCCRMVSVSLLTTSLVEGAVAQRAISATVDVAPAAPLQLQFQFSTKVDIQTALHPASFNWSSRSILSVVQYTTVVAGAVGVHALFATLVGAAAGSYRVEYIGRTVLEVRGKHAVPSVPVPLAVVFSNDGTTVSLSFDSATDKGGYFNEFPCAKLLNFSGCAIATCQWSDSSRVAILPAYSTAAPRSVLLPDSKITILGNTIRPACSLKNTSECTSWSAVPRTSVTVASPPAPSQPVVVISVPLSIGGCSSLTVDLTGSTGAAGRPWASTQFKVLTTLGATTAALELERYLTANFTLNPPVIIPRGAFQTGQIYSIQVTLCSFLGACTSAVKSVTVLASTAVVPIVSILGQSRRSMARSAPLTVNCHAYTQSCSGVVSSANLAYAWTARRLLANGTYVTTFLRSTSQNPAVFRQGAYSMPASSEVQISLRVTSAVSSMSTAASIAVVVVPGAVVAKVVGGATKQLKVGESISLDASQSYDEDAAVRSASAATLQYQWSCVQLSPTFSTTCVLSFPTAASALQSMKVKVTAASAALNTTSQLTVTASDATRSSSAVVSIVVSGALAPKLQIDHELESLTNINTNQQLALYGSLKLFVPCTAAWSVDDQSMPLVALSTTPIMKYLVPSPQGQSLPFNLVLLPGSLPQRSALVFTLSCGTVASVLPLTTNGAPLPGTFNISPKSGEELSTVFVFSAAQWSDPDLPLSYEFGFVSGATQATLMVVSKSELSYTSTTLPAGREEVGKQVNCSLQVFDSLDARAQVQTLITVRSITPQQRDQEVGKLLLSNAGDVDGTKKVLNVISTSLNAANCAGVTNCSSLNRHDCLKTSGVCSECFVGYVGEAGDRSTLCIPANANTVTLCSASRLCPHAWQQCDPLTRTCSAPPKECSQNCSGHGSCIYLNKLSGKVQTTCRLDDMSCDSVCSCVNQYSGVFCEIDAETLRGLRQVRSSLINTLKNLTDIEDINPQSVTAWSESLYSLSLHPYELSTVDINNVAAIANTTLHNALTLQAMSFTDVMGVLQATDTVASLLKYNYNPNDYKDQNFAAPRNYVNNTAAYVVHVISAFGDLVSRSMVLGQNRTTFYYENFRMSVMIEPLLENLPVIAVTSPQSTLEILTGVLPSSASLKSAGSVGDTTAVAVKVIAVYPRSYSTDTSAFISSPLLMQVQAKGSSVAVPASSFLSNIEFTFQHNEPQYQYLHHAAVNFTTVCTKRNESEQHSFVCPESGHVLSHNCSKGAGIHTSFCPKPAPGCAKLGVDSADISIFNGCKLVSYDLTHTVCACPLGGSIATERRSRLLSTEEEQLLDDSGAANMLTSTLFIAEDFADTFTVAKDFNSVEDVQRVLVVIFMLSSLWFPGLLVIVVAWAQSRWRKNKVTSVENSPTTAEAARDKVLAYVNTVIPQVFSDGDYLCRLWTELQEHHMLFTLFASRTEAQQRLVICQTMTLFTFMLFLTAAFFDVSNPGDDGTCPTHTTETACLKRSSPFDSQQRYCQWSDEPDTRETMCTYNTEGMSLTALFYLTVLTTILTAIATIPLDYLFGIISAPTAISLAGSKVRDTLAAVVEGARRMSSIGLLGIRQRVAPEQQPVVPDVTATDDSTDSTARATAGIYTIPATKSILMGYLPAVIHPGEVAANRAIPEEVEQVSSAARTSIPIVAQNSHALLSRSDTLALVRKARSMKRCSQLQLRSSEKTGADDIAHRPVAWSPHSRNPVQNFFAEIIEQRLLMNDGADETVVFDAQWGIQHERHENNAGQLQEEYYLCAEARKTIGDDVIFAETESQKLSAVLSNYSVHHAGLEILHMFMVDLLGRNTPAAKIFQEKFCEEFGHSQVVYNSQKYASVAVVVALNAFFAYYILLKAFQKGYEWQIQYLVCCIVQFAIELFVFETAECVWLNYSVPSFVRKEVAAAADILRQQVEKVTMPSASLCDVRNHEQFSLNAPPHLFLSSKVGRAHPQLLESLIVVSYVHHLPGEICRTWPHYAKKSPAAVADAVSTASWFLLPSRSLVRGFNLSLQLFITIPYLYQRVIIRFVQPIVFSGISLVWFVAVESTAGIVVLCLLVPLFLAVYAWKRYESHRKAQEVPHNSVIQQDEEDTPEHTLLIDIRPIPTFIRDNDDVDEGGKRSEGSGDRGSEDSDNCDDSGDGCNARVHGSIYSSGGANSISTYRSGALCDTGGGDGAGENADIDASSTMYGSTPDSITLGDSESQRSGSSDAGVFTEDAAGDDDDVGESYFSELSDIEEGATPCAPLEPQSVSSAMCDNVIEENADAADSAYGDDESHSSQVDSESEGASEGESEEIQMSEEDESNGEREGGSKTLLLPRDGSSQASIEPDPEDLNLDIMSDGDEYSSEELEAAESYDVSYVEDLMEFPS